WLPSAGGTVEAFNIAGARPFGLIGIDIPAQAGGVRVGAGRAARPEHSVQAVFYHGFGLGPGNAEFPQLISKRHYLDDVSGRDSALQRYTRTAATLQGKVCAAVVQVGRFVIGLDNKLLNISASLVNTAFSVAG